MTVFPNVKLNLGLNVLRKRPDGYHDIETLFIPYFGISDMLDISSGSVLSDRIPGDHFVLSDRIPGKHFVLVGGDWPVETDLSWRAYKMLKDEFSLPEVDITLTKTAPVGAGLGSGSSDAAFTLKALNEMFSLGLDEEELASRAAKLGSDCAFFIYNRPMTGSGRGEILTPYDIDLSGYEIRVEIPEDSHVSTKEAYAGIIPHEPEISLKEALSRPVDEWKDVLFNDFEQSVFASHPEIEALKRRFYDEGAVYAAMSGSGSAVFGIFEK